MFYVYLLKSINYSEKRYIGYTTNINARLKTHNSGKSPHTAAYKPWRLHVCFVFSEKDKATNFETYLKFHAGRAFANKRLW